jgi:uncharacterized protein (DUF427 family)
MRPERIEPSPGQESVWDYPRPPRIEDVSAHILVIFEEVTIADTQKAKRVLETSHPPVYYIPPGDVLMEHLVPVSDTSWCEWKGEGHYYSLVVDGKRGEKAAWYYPHPIPAFLEIKNYIAFYPSRVDACYVNGEKVKAQEGDFYGGWITANIVGPFKGEAGTRGW